MSTSVINRQIFAKHLLHGIAATLAASAFCGIFTAVYYQFSHYVYSDYMTYMFLCPLVCGTLVYAVLYLFRTHVNGSRLAFNLNNSGIAMLTVGMCFVGVLEIAGGDSPYILFFFIGGIAFIIAAAVAFIVAQTR